MLIGGQFREAMVAAGVPELLEGGKLLYVGNDNRGIELEVVAVRHADALPTGGVAVSVQKKKIDPSDFVITTDTEISSIDLDREEFTLRDGRRLTEELAEQLARQAQDEIRQRNLVPGRKSLSGSGQHSPTIRVRVPEQLREQAERRAADEGVSLSALTREALEHYLAS